MIGRGDDVRARRDLVVDDDGETAFVIPDGVGGVVRNVVRDGAGPDFAVVAWDYIDRGDGWWDESGALWPVLLTDLIEYYDDE